MLTEHVYAAHRRELHVHCYRMLASYDEAEDAVQDRDQRLPRRPPSPWTPTRPHSVLLARTFGPERDGDWRLVPTAANRMPAAASYRRRYGDTVFRAFKLDVLPA